jgi:signal transduction histidine kinase
MSPQVSRPAPFADAVAEIVASSPGERLDVLELFDGRVIEQFTRVQEVDNSVVGRVWSYRDITERARNEIVLREAKDAAEAASRAKSEFLAVMSHELRTPLNAIGGYVGLLELGVRGPVTDQQRDDLQRIQKNQRHLLGMINEVLNYARIETGNVKYDLAEVIVSDALAAAKSMIGSQVTEKGLTFDSPDCPANLRVLADNDKLRQILLNLLSNAVKFTPEGGKIAIECSVTPEKVLLCISDTGIGIPEDRLGEIFEPFVQVRSDLARTSEGAGLGLAISRDLARGMGGDLAVESAVGKGSRFILTLPAV